MHIVVAPDSFKESMSARKAAGAMARGIAAADQSIEVIELPVSDGGEGFLDAVCDPLGAQRREFAVAGPMGVLVAAHYCWVENTKTALVEVAQIVGPQLIPAKGRDIWRASSEGLGQLLVHLRDLGAKQIVIGLGGTTTNDGGLGMAAALGITLLDGHGMNLPPALSSLRDARTLRLPSAGVLPGIQITLATDVDAPLLGPNGASAMFGPQKGASVDDVPRLDAALAKWARLLQEATVVDVSTISGGGAAGGIGAALVALAGAKITSGIDLVLDLIDFDGHMSRLHPGDLVFTGEGKVDRQTSEGKAPWGVCQAALRRGIRTVAFCGVRGRGVADLIGPDAFLEVVEIVPPEQPREEVLAQGSPNLAKSVAEFVSSRLSAHRRGSRTYDLRKLETP